jgi:hypothetical protein
MKDIKFVVKLEDIDDSNFSKDERDMILERLRLKYSYGSNFDTAIVIYPLVIAESMKTEERIIHKLNYTVTHELIHVLLRDVDFNDEETAHGLTMIINDDVDSNHSGQGKMFYNRFKGHIEIVANEETKIEVQIPKILKNVTEKTNAARNLSRMRLAQRHELTGL